jgi:hypothetical protein
VRAVRLGFHGESPDLATCSNGQPGDEVRTEDCHIFGVVNRRTKGQGGYVSHKGVKETCPCHEGVGRSGYIGFKGGKKVKLSPCLTN